MTAQILLTTQILSKFPSDNPYNLYNLEAKLTFSQNCPREIFPQKYFTPSVNYRTKTASYLRGGEISC
jgi:hypothetical protein